MIKRGRKAIYSFKNMTKIQWNAIRTPGIFHHVGLGLISISGDGSNWITISDKNLGATEVYNYGDELSEANCGYYYQWGNNYGFPRSGTVTTSSTQVDATGYGPGNYYNSSTYITGNDNWSSSLNDNLRGGETGTVEATQGPSPSGYHVPLESEWKTLFGILTTILNQALSGDNLRIYLKMPFAGGRYWRNSNVEQQGMFGNYWTSTAYWSPVLQKNLVSQLYFYTSSQFLWAGSPQANGLSLRCFKNTPVQPDTSRTVLYQPN